MVLESLFNPRKAQRQPWEMFFVGLVYSSIAMAISLWIFGNYASIIMVFITVMAVSHLVYGTIELAEEQERTEHNRHRLFKEHEQTLKFFIYLFLGFTISFALWYMFLPSANIDQAFGIQQATIENVNQISVGHSIANPFTPLLHILWNNLKVLLICFLFAFTFGLGAIFILTWNASLIGTAMGSFARNSFGGNYFTTFPLAIARYLTHGIFEISAFFLAGMAGGIISIAIIKHEWTSPRFKEILTDSADLFLFSLALLVFAGLVEVFVTATLFA